MRAQTQWRTFLRESPAYPPEAFEGRGIVILAGGLTYMVPAWVNIHMLRRTGFSLRHLTAVCASMSILLNKCLTLLRLTAVCTSTLLQSTGPLSLHSNPHKP